ncbi:DUF4157 domain-containing protein [Cellvibrio mixtus]|nr:DUF4157 domain-containing protein [Cellvibrio mixtus]
MSYTSKQAARESHAAEQQGAKPSAQLFSDQRTSTSAQLKQQHMMGAVQRMGAEEEEPLQGKFATLQRAEDEELLQGKFTTAQLMEEEEPIQGKFDTLQRASAEEEEPLQGKFNSIAPAQLEQKPNNTGLPDNLKSGIENMSGFSMDDVKVHYNSDKPAQLNAHAYAQGTDIHVAPGQEQHLPHEAWHVVQQKQGRVQPTMQMKAGVPVNDDTGLEHEADVMGARALGIGQSSYGVNSTQLKIKTTVSAKPIQCYLTRAESAAGDILHRDRADIFEAATLDKYRDVARAWYPSMNDKVAAVTDAIEDDRDLDYIRMSGDTLTDYAGANAMVGDAREHMYVHRGNTIYRGDRTREKLPHPALVGYDPDVDGAGTLRATFNNNTLRIKVTNSSGHFRPPQVDEETRNKVEQKVRNGKPPGTRVFVDIVDV